jgi:hypothetical protein
MMISQCWQHAGEDLEAQVFLVAQAVGAPLDNADLVFESSTKPRAILFSGVAVGRDAAPMPLDHSSELRTVGVVAI